MMHALWSNGLNFDAILQGESNHVNAPDYTLPKSLASFHASPSPMTLPENMWRKSSQIGGISN